MKKNRKKQGKTEAKTKAQRVTEKYAAFSAMSSVKQTIWTGAALGLGLTMSAVSYCEGQFLAGLLRAGEWNWISMAEGAFLLVSLITTICAFVYAWRLFQAAKVSSLVRKACKKVEKAGYTGADSLDGGNSVLLKGLGNSYQKKLQILLALKQEYAISQQRILEAAHQELNGELTIRKHIDVMENGWKTVCENYEKACETVRLFESQDKAAPERLAILDGYIASSARLLSQLRQFETELGKNKAAADAARQKGASEDLQSLADNVHHYAGRPAGGNA